MRKVGNSKIILMKRIVSLIRNAVLLPAILIVQISFAQYSFSVINNAKDTYRAVHWGLEDGLSEAEVYHMIKDVKGFLWVGSLNGLNRFDGSRFKIFFHDPDNPSTISGNVIYGLIEDSLHNIWIGTDKGLSRYDIRADTFTNFISSQRNRNVIGVLYATRNEVYCLSPDFQLSMYNVHSFKKKNLLKFTSDDKITVTQPNFFDTATNDLWLTHGGGGLLQVSLKDGKKQNYDWPCYKKILHHDHGSPGLCYDKKRNSLWINSPDGLIEFTLADKQFHRVDAFNDWVNLKDYHTLGGGPRLDTTGRVWVSTNPKGIIIYDPSDESVTLPFNNHPDVQKEVSDEILCLYIDRENIAWTGYWSRKGFYQLIPHSSVVTRYAFDSVKFWYNSVGNFMNADHGKLWIGTSQGLNIFDPHTGLFEILRKKDLPGINSNVILPVAIDTIRKKAWLLAPSVDTTQFGSLYEMDISTKKCRPVIFKDHLNQTISPADFFIIPEMGIFSVTPFRNRCIVTAIRDSREVIFMVDNEGSVAKEILSFPRGTHYPFITTDEEHFLFMRGFDAVGNFSFSDRAGKWVRITTPFDSIKYNRIVYNKSDLSYWVIAFQQLIHYDKSFKLIKKYTLKNGLPEFEIYGLGPDNKGNIWFNTDRSIYQLNITTGKVTMLSEKDGLMRQNYSEWGEELRVKDDKGNIYFPAGFFGNGFDKVSPEKFISSPSFVYVKSIAVNQQPLPLPKGVDNINELSLRYFENNISIETGIIDYYSKGQSRIRYKLEGVDTNWQYAPAYYTIRYERLPPRKYKLVMQASNAANEFIGPEKIISMHITPAFWDTWWFRITAAACLIALFYGIMRWRIQQKFRLQLERSEKETQVAELKQKSTELEMQALRAQMNPHFIFNSLNSINRFILKNERTQASEYLTKFSKLVRLILQNSQASLITLDSELESLQLYLNLEALRFNYHFDYKISVPKDMDISALQVPPLILQPYVENAIWHGLMHKEEKGQLDVEVSEEDDHLYFKITDNGIGREKAAALSSKSATKHKSMGLRITAHRIAIIQNSQTMGSPVTINDLVNADGSAAGTEVIIKMPVIYD
jgi:ligand-binding sensor domain-containing protein